MRIHLVVLGAAALLALAGGRPTSGRSRVQGIPLGDLVRSSPKTATPPPSVPTRASPTEMAQVAPAPATTGEMPSTPLSGTFGSTTATNPSLPGATPSVAIPTTVPLSTGSPTTTTTTPTTTSTAASVGGAPSTASGSGNPPGYDHP